MKRQLLTWQFIEKNLGQNIPVTLLYVLESKGSSPGRQGFFMAVTAKEMSGSIGGGIMEHKFVEMAKDLRHRQGSELRKQVHDKSAAKDQSGMICSGEQTVWIYPVQQRDKAVIKNMVDSLNQLQNGTLRLSPAGIGFEPGLPVNDFEFIFSDESNWQYREKTGYKNHLYIIGGGHCALALSRLVGDMDFHIHVFEERAELNTLEANSYAREKVIVSDYSELAQCIPSGKNNYVVIMTFGYRTDDRALRALLQKDLKYLGLLGSRKKIEKMFTDYRGEGVPDEQLKSIHAPIGLSIKSETPEEIAVSIAAEIINVKNK